MMLTLGCTKSSSSSCLFHIFNSQFIHSFFSLIYLDQATRAHRNIKQGHKNMHEVETNTNTEDYFYRAAWNADAVYL